jgi:uncharacterized protein (DUF2236 family)
VATTLTTLATLACDHPLGARLEPDTLLPDGARRAARPLVGPDRLAGLPAARWLIRRQLSGMFGGPDLGRPGDPGLLPTEAVSWRVLAEPAAIAGGLRGLLLQTVHPLAMAGVAEHSRYESDPLGRLAGTSAWVTVSTFGSAERTLELARRVRAMHRRVRGVADGRAYAADDPQLLAWVQSTLTASLLATHQLFAPRPLSPSDADRFVREQAFLGALLDPRTDLQRARRDGIDAASTLPLLAEGSLATDRAGLAAGLRRWAPTLHVGPTARATIDFLRRAPLPTTARPPYLVMLAGAGASLPPALAAPLGLETSLSRIRALAALLTSMRAGVGLSPSLALAREERG